MAEVLDIISRLTYQANTTGLDQSIATIGKEIKSIDDLTASIVRLDTLRDKTDKANLAMIAKIDAALENRKKKLREEIQLVDAKIRTDDNLRKSLAQTGLEYARMSDRIVKGSNAADQSLINLGRIVQDLPYGFLGIANNLNPALEGFQRLKAESGSTGAAIKALGTSLIGAGGIGIAISVVSSLLVTFGSRLFDSGEKAKTATKYVSDYDKAIEKLGNSIGEEIGKLYELENIASNTNLSYKERGKAVDDLQEKYPEYFGNLNRELILNGQISQIHRQIISDLIARGKAQAQYDIIARESARIAEAQLELDRLSQNDKNVFFYDKAREQEMESARGAIALGEARIKQATQSIDAINSVGAAEAFWIDQNAKKAYMAKLEEGKADALLTEKERGERDKRLKEQERIGKQSLKLAEQLQNEYEQLLTQFKEANQNYDKSYLDNLEKDIAERKKRINDLVQGIRSSPTYQRFAPATQEALTGISQPSDQEAGDLFTLINDQQIRDKVNRENKKREEEREERKKKRNASVIDSEKQLATTLIGVYESTLDRQVQLLDLEISIRSQRQQQAIELAKRGNIEILQAETERLEEAQREREKATRKQVELNAILQASNSAVAAAQALQVVTNAGATGDPYTTAARIAAAVAALAAGFAVVANLRAAFNNNQSSGFAEGGYTGDGAKYQKAGVVHKGEFVFTKEKTAQYKPVFEAIHTGKYNPYKGGFGDNKKELSDIRRAVEDISINAENRLDGNGLHQVVTTTQKINRRKWN